MPSTLNMGAVYTSETSVTFQGDHNGWHHQILVSCYLRHKGKPPALCVSSRSSSGSATRRMSKEIIKVKLWGNEGVAPPILNHGTGWMRVIRFIPWPLYPRRENHRCGLDRRVGGHVTRSRCFGEKSLALVGFMRVNKGEGHPVTCHEGPRGR